MRTPSPADAGLPSLLETAEYEQYSYQQSPIDFAREFQCELPVQLLLDYRLS